MLLSVYLSSVPVFQPGQPDPSPVYANMCVCVSVSVSLSVRVYLMERGGTLSCVAEPEVLLSVPPSSLLLCTLSQK